MPIALQDAFDTFTHGSWPKCYKILDEYAWICMDQPIACLTRTTSHFSNYKQLFPFATLKPTKSYHALPEPWVCHPFWCTPIWAIHQALPSHHCWLPHAVLSQLSMLPAPLPYSNHTTKLKRPDMPHVHPWHIWNHEHHSTRCKGINTSLLCNCNYLAQLLFQSRSESIYCKNTKNLLSLCVKPGNSSDIQIFLTGTHSTFVGLEVLAGLTRYWRKKLHLGKQWIVQPNKWSSPMLLRAVTAAVLAENVTAPHLHSSPVPFL